MTTTLFLKFSIRILVNGDDMEIGL